VGIVVNVPLAVLQVVRLWRVGNLVVECGTDEVKQSGARYAAGE
jgi:hypothetical protein